MKTKKTNLRMIIIICLTALVIIVAELSIIPGSTPAITDSKGMVLPNSIASLEKIKIGGVDQWILIRAEDTSNPVILFLHGGPGTTQMGLMRNYTKKLEKKFIVVNWDQRGAGKSYEAIRKVSGMNISQFVSDTHELTEQLCRRFKKNKIYLAGHSWGSVLGVLTVQKYPENYYAYVGIGQVADMRENERVSYEWTLKQAELAKDQKSVMKLKKIGPPPYSGDWQAKVIAQRSILGTYGGEVYGNPKGAFPVVIKHLLGSTEYNLPDKINFFRGIFGSMRLLWPELLKMNLIQQVPELKVPVYFLLGKHDYEAPYILAEKYYETLQAPSKELIWFENSAHMLNTEENRKFIDTLVNKVLPATYTD